MLQRPYEAVRDFFNFYALANGVFDSNGYYVTAGKTGSSGGIDFGGGASGYHEFSRGALMLSYRGDYRKYFSPGNPDGTNQELSFAFEKNIGRRWSFGITEVAGIFFIGGAVYSTEPNPVNPSTLVQTNPFSTKTRYEGTNFTLTYIKSLRMSYSFTGSYFLSRYNAGVSYGSNDATGLASMNYRLTKRTTISGTYSHSYFIYQHGGGDSNVDGFFGTVSHEFSSKWQGSVAGGISRVQANGTVAIPVNVTIGQQIVPVYVIGKYSQTSIVPNYQATLSRGLRHASFAVSGGQSVSPGNGFFLASRTLGLNALYVYNMRRANLSAGLYYSRLSSVANTVSETARTIGFGGSYGYQVLRHMGVNFRYDYVSYGNFGGYSGGGDNRLSAGVYFTSKDIPISLF